VGMFDNLRCRYPLPVEDWQRPLVEGKTFQTKDTPDQDLDLYEIREDGTLWRREDDEWLPEGLTARIDFYCDLPMDQPAPGEKSGWVEFSAVFLAGKLQVIALKEFRTPCEPEAPPVASTGGPIYDAKCLTQGIAMDGAYFKAPQREEKKT